MRLRQAEILLRRRPRRGGRRYRVLLGALRGQFCLAVMVACLAVRSVAGQEAAAPTSPDADTAAVANRLAALHQEIEQLRFAMGRPREQRAALVVSGAALREVYFQAATLFRKSDRLRFENTRQRSEPPPTAIRMDAAAVLQVVDASLATLRTLRQELEIEDHSVERLSVESATPSALFSSIVQANRQLNLLLDRQFAPSDVYEQVTRAISYASLLLRQFDGAERIPDPPEFVAGKQPVDVYRRLLDCLARVRKIMSDSDMSMLELRTVATDFPATAPSDVYDIASLLVSELAHLHSRLPETTRPLEPYYPGVRFPAHVFQRAGILESQLATLEELVDRQPDWLQRQPQQP